VAWRNRVRNELCELNHRRAKLQAITDGTSVAQEKRRGLIATLAAKLLGGEEASDLDVTDAADIDTNACAVKARSDAARIAIESIDKQIAVMSAGFKRLAERVEGDVSPAMVEHLKTEYSERYRRAFEELRDVSQLVAAGLGSAGLVSFTRYSVPEFGLIRNGSVFPKDELRKTFYDLINSWTQ
jgi:hypothetical protein